MRSGWNTILNEANAERRILVMIYSLLLRMVFLILSFFQNRDFAPDVLIGAAVDQGFFVASELNS